MAEIRFDANYVSAVVNEIAEHAANIAALNQTLLDRAEEEVRVSRGDNGPFNFVKDKVAKEVENVNALVKSQEAIQEVLDEYARIVEQANDTSELEGMCRND